MKTEYRQVTSAADMDAAKSVRLTVFVGEQSVPPEVEMDGHDAEALHVICIADGKAVATGRLAEMPDGLKLGRVAVLAEYRKQGIGTGIVRWLLRAAVDAGHGQVYANVQTGAMDFYRKLDFRAVGSRFREAGIDHIRMTWDRPA